MKQLFTILLVLSLLIFCLAACGGDEEEKPDGKAPDVGGSSAEGAESGSESSSESGSGSGSGSESGYGSGSESESGSDSGSDNELPQISV